MFYSTTVGSLLRKSCITQSELFLLFFFKVTSTLLNYSLEKVIIVLCISNHVNECHIITIATKNN